MSTRRERELKAEENYTKKKQGKPLKWENLIEKCKKCGAELEPINEFKGMFKKGKGDNYQLYRCDGCKEQVWIKI